MWFEYTDSQMQMAGSAVPAWFCDEKDINKVVIEKNVLKWKQILKKKDILKLKTVTVKTFSSKIRMKYH